MRNEPGGSAAGDRWFLEVRIPSKDMRVERLKPGGEWHINICSNSRNGISTWTAVGQAFHNPGGFGKLIIDDYAKWRQERPQRLLEARSRILKQADALGWPCRERLSAIDAFDARNPRQGTPADWEAITRDYTALGYVDHCYRCLTEEIRYQGLFK